MLMGIDLLWVKVVADQIVIRGADFLFGSLKKDNEACLVPM